MLGEVGGGLARRSKGRVLGNRASLHCVSVVVHQVALLRWIKHLSRSSVFLSNVH